MAAPQQDPLPETAFDTDPPTPEESRRYRWLIQLWVVFFLIIVLTGLLNFVWSYFKPLFDRLFGGI
jgi:hypothetical protein